MLILLGIVLAFAGYFTLKHSLEGGPVVWYFVGLGMFLGGLILAFLGCITTF